MKINEALLNKIKNRFVPNSYKRSGINIYKKRETLYNHSAFSIKSNALCSNILSHYKIGNLEISSEYFQFLSYFFMPDRKAEASKAIVYKEKYLKAKEINKLSETIFNKKEKEANTIFTALQKEYVNLKSEYIIQTKEKNSIKENEKLLLKELKDISSLDTETLELRIETLYIEKIKRERNPHGPKQIARLIKNSSDDTQKREFIRLYKEFDKLNIKEVDSTKILNINNVTENIFTQIKELIVNSKEFISNELSKKVESIKEMPKTIVNDIHQDLKVFEKQMPIILNEDIKRFEPVQKSILKSTIKEKKEKESINIIHNYQNLTQKDDKERSISKLHNYLFEKEILNMKDEKPYIFITSQIKKDISHKIETFLHKNIENVEVIENRLITNEFFMQGSNKLQDTKVEKEEQTIIKNIYNLVKEQIVEDSPMALISASKKKTIYKEISKILSKRQEITTKEIKILSSIVKENSNSVQYKEHFSMLIGDMKEKSIIKHIKDKDKDKDKDTRNRQDSQDTKVEKEEQTIIKNIYNLVKEQIVEDSPMALISASKKKTIYKEISKILSKRQEITTKEIKILSSIVKENSNSVQYKEHFSMLIGDMKEKSIIKHIKDKDTRDRQDSQDTKVEKEEQTIIKNIYNLVKEQIVEDSPMALISASKKKTIYKEISKILSKRQEITTKEIKILSSIVKENSNSVNIIKDFTDSQKHYIGNSNLDNLENNIKYISSRYRTLTKDSKEDSFIKNQEVSKQHETIVNSKKENIEEYVSQTVLDKKAEVENHINSVIVNMDDNLDELALKIFREIKDEISMEYRR